MTRQIHRQIWGLMFPATCISISVSTAYTHVQWVGKHSLAKDCKINTKLGNILQGNEL